MRRGIVGALSLLIAVSLGTSSLLAQNPKAQKGNEKATQQRRDQATRRGPFSFLLNPATSKELGLTPSQEKKIQGLLEKSRQEAEKIRTTASDPQTRRQAMLELRERTMKSIQAILNPDQQKKFQEMMARRPMGPGFGPRRLQRMLSQLNLTPDQQKKINSLLEQHQKTMRQLMENAPPGPPTPERREKFRQAFEKFWAQLEKVLTPEQREKLQRLRTESFGGPPNRGGFGGPRR